MSTLEQISIDFVSAVWGLPLVFLLFGAGAIFTTIYTFPQIRHFFHAIKIVRGDYDDDSMKGEINHFQALCAALSATLGLGNIAGVAVAIASGGPGAVFWMWVAGFLGMATKFTSISLALMFRDESGSEVHGGPMYTIKNGLGKAFLPMALAYAFFIILSSFGAGNMFQSNQMASILDSTLSIPTWLSGSIFTVLAAMVLIGGIKRIGNVAGKLVPIMVVIYFLGALGILFYNIDKIPGLIFSIFNDAFTGTAAIGGFAGIAFKEVVIQGVRRAVFSNEAGMGSAAIAHTAAKSNPIQEGLVGLLGPFIDTIVVCSITALALLVTGVWTQGGIEGSEMTAVAFETLYGPLGRYIITLTVVLFAFSTIISWSYYGEQGAVFLWGEKAIVPYRLVFISFILIGSVLKLDVVLNFSDAVFGLLAIPNLLANILLTKKLKVELKGYEASMK
ncbi:MAG: sodium:alanine symporter family protein [Halobacteriovoraceae bacterium]|nr:sodium:alanine symporter family protein [Halobacteriovoraceae bacterium]MCB9094048.1 sodium:alanine symporter family protein [Halobacteriovoraceae bacterium]